MNSIKPERKDLFGIILIGGQSHRMGQPKACIEYKGEKLAIRTAKLLREFVDEVYLSGRKEQIKLIKESPYPFIIDHYSDIGPIAGILSGFEKTKKRKALLVIATDMPYLEKMTIQKLLEKRNTQKIATMYFQQKTNFLEPLCAIYEVGAYAHLFEAKEKGNLAIHKIFSRHELELIPSPKNNTLANLNYPGQLDELD